MIDPAAILVTGGQGRLGRALSAEGCRAVSRHDLDITSALSIAAHLSKARPSLVINAAAYTAVDLAESEPERAHAINGLGAGLLAEACKAASIPLIHVSTDMVFDDGIEGEALNEEHWAAPMSVYGQSKLEGEHRVKAAGGRAISVRVSWLFDERADSFIGKILKAAEARDHLKLVNDEFGRPTPVGDLARTLVQLGDKLVGGEVLPPVLNLGPPDPVSRLDWAMDIFAARAEAGIPSPTIEPVTADAFPTPAKRPRHLVLDVSRAEALLGAMPDWRPASRAAVKALMT